MFEGNCLNRDLADFRITLIVLHALSAKSINQLAQHPSENPGSDVLARSKLSEL